MECGANKSNVQHARGWPHEVTKDILNANKMTDTVNDMFRCTYMTIDVNANTRR